MTGRSVANGYGARQNELIIWGGASVAASATVQPAETLTKIPFTASSVLPLIARGFMADPDDEGGNIVFLRSGIYLVLLELRVTILGGAAGTFDLFRYLGDTLTTSQKASVDVDFSDGRTNVLIESTSLLTISSASLAGGGGSSPYNYRVQTSGAGMTWRYGSSTFTSGTAVSLTILRLSDYYL